MTTFGSAARVDRESAKDPRLVSWAAAVLMVTAVLWVRWSGVRGGSWADLEVYLRGAQAIVSRAPLYVQQPGVLPFTYSPFAAVAFTPLHLVSSTAARWVFTLGSLVSYLTAVAAVGWRLRLPRRYLVLVALAGMALEPFVRTILLGQVNLYLMAAVVVDCLVIRSSRRGWLVGLAAGIDGLVHLSDLSWHEPGEAAVRNYKKGQEVEAIVLAVDVDRERISLGIKQLDSDPFTSYTSVNDRGMSVTGKVKMVDARGAEIQLNEDVTGYLRASEISRDRVEDARNVLKEGDEVNAVILAVDRKTRSIQLSIKAKDNADNQEAMTRLTQTSERENAGTTSLGALLRAKLDNQNPGS